ncbi:MAG: TAXI family TRAP transporter solute-binding subunit [Euryarchaeota archaeon]|nr:TAXI family TRAP transporter solute-binding subunit [Euryarchaeota archaeon]
MEGTRVTRRRALAGLSAVGVAATVGCLGGSQRLTLGVGPVGSRSHRAGQALSVAADRHGEGLSLGVESVDGATERLYALTEGGFAAVGVDNTTLYRAAEGEGVFDLDPIEDLPYQGFGYGRLDHYWLTTGDAESTADLDGRTVYPVQPGEPSRLVTEQLLRAADRWESVEIDNRHRDRLAEAVETGTVGVVAAVEINGQRLTPWCRALDDRVGSRLGVLEPDNAFESAIAAAPNAVGREIEPTGWAAATLSRVGGWSLPMQWLVAPSADSEAVAELTRIAHEHRETIRAVDELALDRSEPAALSAAVLGDQPIHEGVAAAFQELGVWDDDWTVGDAVD